MRIVDSQIHLFDATHPEHAQRIGQVALTPEAVVAAMNVAGVARGYLVPSGSSANRICLDAARTWPEHFNVMGSVKLNQPDPALLNGWLADGYTGIRLTFPPFREPSWLRDGTADWIWPAAADRDIPIMIWAPEQFDEIASVARQNPTLRLVVDHLNLYVEDRGPTVTEVARRLTQLAKYPNVAVKASALPANSEEPYPYRDMFDAVRIAVDAFGVDRVFWGTDLTRLPGTLGEAVTMFTENLDFLVEEELATVMGEGVLRWIGWRDGQRATEG